MNLYDLYLTLRIVKVLSVAMLFTGTLGAFVPSRFEDRSRFAYWIAGPAFGLTWIAGFLLTWTLSVSLLSWWILLAFVLSMFSLQVVLFVAGKDGRRGPISAFLAIAPLVTTVVIMIAHRR